MKKLLFPDFQPENWTEYTCNPVVDYRTPDGVKTAVGDPTVVLPGEFDGLWHLFCHGFRNDNYAPLLFHFVSEDGLVWENRQMQPMEVNPTYLFRDGNRWILYYSAVLYTPAEQAAYQVANVLRARWSEDLEHWSEPVDLLAPELPWEREADPDRAWCIQTRNPCMCRLPNGRYRLYYSAGTVLLRDCGYEEPKYISFAEADSPLGPFIRHGSPILAPDNAIPHRNYGAGALKVFSWREQFLGLYNSIYVDDAGVSRSAINVVVSRDGITWTEAPYNPIIRPTDRGWNSTLIYQLDLVQWGNELRLYYNARQGSADGSEAIGCAMLNRGTEIVAKLR